MDDLIRLGEPYEIPNVDLTDVLVNQNQSVQLVDVPKPECGAALVNQTPSASESVFTYFLPPRKHKTDSFGSNSNPKIPRYSNAIDYPSKLNNGICTLNNLNEHNNSDNSGRYNCIVGNLEKETNTDSRGENFQGPQSLPVGFENKLLCTSTLSNNFSNTTKNNCIVTDSNPLFSKNNESHKTGLPTEQPSTNLNCTITSADYSLLNLDEQVPVLPFKSRIPVLSSLLRKNNVSHKIDLNNWDKNRSNLTEESAFGFPTDRPSKKYNCTITSGEYSLLNLDEQVQELPLNSESCKVSNDLKKNCLIETNVPNSSLNVEVQQPLLIQDSTPINFNKSLNKPNCIESTPLDDVIDLIIDEEGRWVSEFKDVDSKMNPEPNTSAANSDPIRLSNWEPQWELPKCYSPLLEIFSDIDINFLKQYIDVGFTVEQIVEEIMGMDNDYPKCQKSLIPLNCDMPGDTKFTPITTNNSKNNAENVVVDLSLSDVTSLPNDCINIVSSTAQQITSQKPNKFDFLQEILPDADPDFLKEISKLNEEKMKTFIDGAIESNDYPKITKVLPKEESNEDDNIELYSTDFDIEKFIKIFPEPFTFFKNPERICQSSEHSLAFLKKRYRKCYLNTITKFYKQNKYNLTLTCEDLDKEMKTSRQTTRPLSSIKTPVGLNLPFLQEACFIEHMVEIKLYIEKNEEMKKAAYELAKERGELIECGCCYDQIMFENCATCSDGDLFCKLCIQKSAEIRIGEGRITFPCLSDCGSNFSLQTLQGLLEAHVFSKLLQRIQMEEVRSADIEGLEMCPFCEFATIPPPDTKIFSCMNPDCLKESCRQCHKVTHIPLRCDEVENDDQAKARKFIEDEMTKALVRECYKCKKSFIKTDGCNKMTCTCGAKMCYICREPIKDYKHFNGPGGIEENKCPLFSSDNLLHVEAVKETAQKAMEMVTSANPNLKLKHDPSKLLPTNISNTILPTGVVEDPHVLLQRIFEARPFIGFPYRIVQEPIMPRPIVVEDPGIPRPVVEEDPGVLHQPPLIQLANGLGRFAQVILRIPGPDEEARHAQPAVPLRGRLQPHARRQVRAHNRRNPHQNHNNQ